MLNILAGICVCISLLTGMIFLVNVASPVISFRLCAIPHVYDEDLSDLENTRELINNNRCISISHIVLFAFVGLSNILVSLTIFLLLGCQHN